MTIATPDKTIVSSSGAPIKTKNTKFEYGTDRGTDNKIFNVMGHKYDEILETVIKIEGKVVDVRNYLSEEV